MKRVIIFVLFFSVFVLLRAKEKESPVFLAQKIDGPTENWYGPFSEGSAVFDVNNDGILDITSGANWYEGPHFSKKQLRLVKPYGEEFLNNGGEYPYDLNGDGWTDIISWGWFDDYNIYWYENNKNSPGLWEKHKLADSERIEFVLFEDIDNDGSPDFILCNMKPNKITVIEVDESKFTQHVIGPHVVKQDGMGVGDINGDHRADIISSTGWYEAPDNPLTVDWKWHPEFDIGGMGSLPMLIYDVNADGMNDIIYGMGHHSYGIYWLQQKIATGKRTWIKHAIDETWSQAHALSLADINGDGRKDLITGKRLRGHSGKDLGALEPLGLYWYDIDNGSFTKHVIAYNSMVGTGMQINVLDIDKDGDKDIIVSGKSGLYLLENMTFFTKQTDDIIQR